MIQWQNGFLGVSKAAALGWARGPGKRSERRSRPKAICPNAMRCFQNELHHCIILNLKWYESKIRAGSVLEHVTKRIVAITPPRALVVLRFLLNNSQKTGCFRPKLTTCSHPNSYNCSAETGEMFGLASRLALPLALAFAALPLVGQNIDLGTESQIRAGKELYLNYCAHCHGEEGDGMGSAAHRFVPRPRDFTSGKYKIRTTPSGELPMTEDLVQIIRAGMPFSAMPAFPNLSDEELLSLAYYLKTFNEDFEDEDFAPVPLTFPKAPKFSEESALRGRQVYIENECYTCHGDQGRSDGVSAPTLEDDFGPVKYHIRAADLTKRWANRGGSTREDIYRTFTTGLNGTPMPSYEDSIPEDKRWDLVNYIYSLSERDEANFSTTLVAAPVVGDLDPTRGEELFANATTAYFPIVGQVIEPGRMFAPSSNAVSAQAVFNDEAFAILLRWHDMTADTSGSNAPDTLLEEEETDQLSLSGGGTDRQEGQYSDAIAIQWPKEAPEGFEKPYFLFGNPKKAVDLWFTDLANPTEVKRYSGNGFSNLVSSETGENQVTASFHAGEWSVIFTGKRERSDSMVFSDGTFIPFAVFVWDGFNRETGVKTGITSWYSLYLQPADAQSPIVPMFAYGLLTLIIELLIIYLVRRYRAAVQTPATQPA